MTRVFCIFDVIEGVANCRRCGRPYATKDQNPARHHRHCTRPDAPEVVPTAKPAIPEVAPQVNLDCSHRGLTVRGVECATCGGGKKRLAVLACSIYGECSLASIAGVRNCEACIRAGENHPHLSPGDGREAAPGAEVART